MILEASGLSKSFTKGGKVLQAVNDVSLQVAGGEVLAFLGPNGAGKTTTIKMVCGLLAPDSGSVRVNGRDPISDSAARIDIGAVLEGNRNLYLNLTARENLEYFAVLKGLSARHTGRRADELLELTGLTEKRNTLVSDLSRGMQQKLAIAVSLVQRPPLLMLDEPTLGLDVEASEAVKVMLRQLADQGCALVLTTHQMDVAQAVADRVAIIRSGSIIAEGTTDALIRRFSAQSFKLRFDGTLSTTQINRLEELDVDGTEAGTLVFPSEPALVYSVLEALKPLPILGLEKADADLTTIFLRLVKEDNHA